MAAFCNVCAEKMGVEADFNIENIFNRLKEDHYQIVLCEGCTLSAISKQKGEMKLLPYDKIEWMNKTDFFEKYGN